MNRQSARPRYYWIESGNKISTNLIKTDIQVEDSDDTKIELFITALYEDGRLSEGQTGFVHAEEHQGQNSWDDLSGLELDPIKVREARSEEMKDFAKQQVYIKTPIK